jgi:hypothetical protein
MMAAVFFDDACGLAIGNRRLYRNSRASPQPTREMAG